MKLWQAYFKVIKNSLSVLFVSALIFISGCHCENQSVKTTSGAEVAVEKIIIDNSYSQEGRPDYSVDSLFILNDILHLSINYSGGCKEHSFQLFSNGMFGKSLPPQVSVHLQHNSNGDNCRELINKELQFNISPLKYNSSKKIIINFDGTQKVIYNY
ncbi:MAG: hypothetical protein JJE25_04245 [Bacteroidia bacterium]|nr:hypothetical protein [Bacteroidia bacterium]